MSTDTSGPAFPGSWNQNGEDGHTGLSKREWFAGQALVGLLALPGEDGTDQYTPEEAAKRAFAMADAMIAASQQPAASVNAELLAAAKAMRKLIDTIEPAPGPCAAHVQALKEQADAAIAAAEPV